jgi:hypothetical protein
MTIRVHIERLVIESGAEAADAPRIRRGLQRELTRLLRAGGLSHEVRNGAALPLVRGGPIAPGPDRTPASLGSRLARAVYQGIGDRT